MSLNAKQNGFLILTVLGFAVLMLGNNIIPLTHPDEVFYVQTAKEMVQHKTWMVPYIFGQPQFEKPIMTYGLLRAAFLLFGVTSFSSRFFPALFAILGVLAVYAFILKINRDYKKAFISALILMTSGLYVGLARTVFTDLIFSIFILFAMLSFFLAYSDATKKNTGVVFFYVFSALAVLTKGPLGFIIPFESVFLFLLIRRETHFLRGRPWIWGLALFLALALPWYIFMIQRYGHAFIQEFFYNDHFRRIIEAEHKMNDRWFFYPLSMAGCMFPWSIFVLFAFPHLVRRLREPSAPPIYLFLACWIGVVFVVFQIAHSKLVSYIFPLFPALAILAGEVIQELSESSRTRKLSMLFRVTACLLFLFPGALVFAAGKYPEYIPSKAPIIGLIVTQLIILGVL